MPLPTIESISRIRGLGVYRELSSGQATSLRRRNLVYGFNGSGKTTLSRILASVAQGTRQSSLPSDGFFEVALSDGSRISSDHLPDNLLAGRLQVFNEDYVEQNLKWKEGVSTPIFYLGAGSAADAARLEEALRRQSQIPSALQDANKQKSNEVRLSAEFRRAVAREIASRLNLGRRYDATDLVADFEAMSSGTAALLSDDAVKALEAIIAVQEHLPMLPQLKRPSFALQELLREVRQVCGYTLGSIALLELQQHTAMLSWARDGLRYHAQHELQSCLFCGNSLTAERRSALSKAVDAGYERLVQMIAAARQTVSEAQRSCMFFRDALPGANDVTPVERAGFARARDAYRSLLADAEQILGEALAQLEAKAAMPSRHPSELRLLSDENAAQWDAHVRAALDTLNEHVERHNDGYKNFSSLQKNACDALKGHILTSTRDTYLSHNAAVARAEAAANALVQEESALGNQIKELKARLLQHGPAAAAINAHLANYLGRDEIKLAAVEGAFQILRNGSPLGGPLSEGERTAIALSYFVASVRREGRKLEEQVVVLDDPISSLDTRALHYAVSFIRAELDGAAQLVLLTHNLHFMNEVKKWIGGAQLKNVKGEPPTAALLFVDSVQSKDGIRSSTLKSLPSLLRDYESEYHHLFSLVWAWSEKPDRYDGYFYLLPNALRKVLEVFLAFHYPGTEGLASKVQQALRSDYVKDKAEIQALLRLAHAESHGDSLQDLVALSPQTVEETMRCVSALRSLMKALSPGHYAKMEKLCRKASEEEASGGRR